MLVDIVTDSSNNPNGIRILLKARKDLAAIADFGYNHDELVRGWKIFAMTPILRI